MLTDDQMREALVAAVETETRVAATEEMIRDIMRRTVIEPMARASAELPPGSAADQLRNYAGRAWEIINTPTFARLYRIVVAEVPEYPALARFFSEEVSGPVRHQLEVIISRGIGRGEFRQVAPSAAARALTGSLLTQAFWCNHADVWGHMAGGVASRVVPDTLSLILDGLHRPESRHLSPDGRSK